MTDLSHKSKNQYFGFLLMLIIVDIDKFVEGTHESQGPLIPDRNQFYAIKIFSWLIRMSVLKIFPSCRDRTFATAEKCPPQPNFLNSPFDSSDSIWLDWLVESTMQWGPSQCSRGFRWLEGSPNSYHLLIIVPIAILYLRSPYIRKWGRGKRNLVFISINSHSTLILGQQPTADSVVLTTHNIYTLISIVTNSCVNFPD